MVQIESQNAKCTYRTLSKLANVHLRRDSPGAAEGSSLAGNICRGKKARIGVHGARETPVPIPNTAVKPSSGYNTWVLALGK